MPISMYQITYKTFKQRYWKKRADGIRQRYWKKRYKAVIKYKGKRFDFYGTPEEIRKAVTYADANRIIPKRRFVRGSAKKFMENPERYGYKIK